MQTGLWLAAPAGVAPQITGASLSPSSVNVTSGTPYVQMDGTLLDSVAGPASAAMYLYPPTGTFSIENESLYYAFFPFRNHPGFDHGDRYPSTVCGPGKLPVGRHSH